MTMWDERTLQLFEARGWPARPRFERLVVGRGAVRFGSRDDWVVVPAAAGTTWSVALTLGQPNWG